MSSSTLVCPHCGGTDVDKDPARGDAVCTGCGSVLEDTIIVSEVQFAEGAGGASSVIGQFISSEGGSAPSMALSSGTFHPGMAKESRAITLQKGRKKIVDLAAMLKLNQHCVDTAYNFFKMAVSRRLTRGRKSAHVIAACLYLVCRTEGTPHMLLDFSDVLQINVYTLGKTYLALARLLCINVPAIDPSLLIPRFAHKLEFGDKEHAVCMTALRLVGRMKRDWMATGRRPSGLCGAALLVASRIHNFCRTKKDIIGIVKVCEHTLRKRLIELEETPSSNLTIDEFHKIDLEEEADPPAFTASRLAAKQKMIDDQLNISEVGEEITEVSKEIDQALETKSSRRLAKLEKEAQGMLDIKEVMGEDLGDDVEATAFLESEVIHETLSEAHVCDDSTDGDLTPHIGPRPTAASLGIGAPVTPAEEPATEDPGDGELDITGLDDEELDAFIMTEDEVMMKEKAWMTLNGEFLQEQEEKARRKAEEEAAKPPKQKRKGTKRKHDAMVANTAGEAMEKMLQEKKFSSKINYDVLKNLNNAHMTDLSKPLSPVKSISTPSTSSVQSEPKSQIKKVSLEGPSLGLLVSKQEEPPKVTVESGPVEHHYEEEDHYEEEEEDGPISAARLFGHGGNASDEEDYYD